MANEKNPYEDGIYPEEPAPRSGQPVAPTSSPYDVLPDPIGPQTVVTKAEQTPYSAFNTVGRMATDALVGIPDTITMLQRGAKAGFNRGLDYLTGETPPDVQPRGAAIPYIAPIARKAVGVAELPEDAGWGRTLLEGGGSALMGGLGSVASKAVVRGAKAAPEVIGSILNPSRPIKSITEDALDASGQSWYKALDNLDVRYTPQTGPNIANAIDRGAFKPKGINDTNAGQTYSNIDQLRNIDPAANVPYGTVKDYVVPRDIEGVRQALNRTRTQAPLLPGHREGEAANTAISGIDRFFQNPPASAIHPTNINDPSLVGPVLSNARGDTAASHRLGLLEGTRDEIGTRLAAKPNASGSVEAQALRDRTAAALNSKNLLYGFNDYEKQLLEKAATASWLARYGANAPKSLMGAMMQGGSIGGVSLLAQPFTGFSHSVSAMLAAGIPASEYVAKKLADWGTRRSYQSAADAIAARSPLAQSMGIPAPPTARMAVRPAVTRDDIAAALMAPSVLRQREQR